MILILEVTSPLPTIGGASRQTFRAEGGTIGRENDNSWVLPHSKISGHHAVISYRNATYYIEDTSRNGICLNSSKNRLERGRPYALKSGDRILMDPYEIRVSITRDQNDAAERNVGELSDVRSSDPLFDASNPFDADDPFAPRSIPSSGLDTPAEEIAGQPLDPLELLNLRPKHAPPRKAHSAKDLELGSLLEGHYQPPAVVPAPPSGPPANAMTIPQDYDPLAPDEAPSMSRPSSSVPPRDERAGYRSHGQRATPLHEEGRIPLHEERGTPLYEEPAMPLHQEPAVPPYEEPAVPLHEEPVMPLHEERPAPLPSIAPARISPSPQDLPSAGDRAPIVCTDPASAADFASVLAGAGVDPANVTPEVARAFGQILRVVVSGVMDVMRSRQQIKDEFRMRMTRVRAVENNPLKFSANVDDALHNLLVKRSPAYLPPVEAFEDAFADLRHHQIAMLAGMRVAFESMLAEFDPDRLQEEFDRRLNKGLVPAKLRYWDLFREKRQEIVKDPEASFRRLFGEEFARAYEDQLKQLKARESTAGGASARTPKQPDT